MFSNYTYPVYYEGNKTFAEYQAAGDGANSTNLEPIFDSDSTLVPRMLALDNLGTAITGITDDMNGSTRSTTTPDMGALEFTPTGSPLSGTYTIGSGGNYANFQAARDELVAKTISGPVIFNILSGTYDEPLLLDEVLGASATNTITFQSADANAESVIWENTANSSANNYVLKLNGTDHITMKNITFKNQGSSYSQKVVLSGVTDSVTIESNIFLGYQGGGSTNHVVIYGSGADAEALKIKNNTFTDAGYYAIYLDSDNSSSPPTGLEISGNTLTNTYGGIYVEYFNAPTIQGNTVKGSYMTNHGIYLAYCDVANIPGNTIKGSGAYTGAGISINYCDGANIIENNQINAPAMTYGIDLNYC